MSKFPFSQSSASVSPVQLPYEGLLVSSSRPRSPEERFT